MISHSCHTGKASPRCEPSSDSWIHVPRKKRSHRGYRSLKWFPLFYSINSLHPAFGSTGCLVYNVLSSSLLLYEVAQNQFEDKSGVSSRINIYIFLTFIWKRMKCGLGWEFEPRWSFQFSVYFFILICLLYERWYFHMYKLWKQISAQIKVYYTWEKWYSTTTIIQYILKFICKYYVI